MSILKVKTDKGWVDIPAINGITPHIGDNGNWWIGDKDTGMPSRGESGASVTPLFANSVDELTASGDTTKLYVLPDGYIYAYINGAWTNTQQAFTVSDTLEKVIEACCDVETIPTENYNLLKASECTFSSRLQDDSAESIASNTNNFVTNVIPVENGKYYTISRDLDGTRITYGSAESASIRKRINIIKKDNTVVYGQAAINLVSVPNEADSTFFINDASIYAVQIQLYSSVAIADASALRQNKYMITCADGKDASVSKAKTADYVDDETMMPSKTIYDLRSDDTKQNVPTASEYKIIFPRWAEIHPFKDYGGIYNYTNAMNTETFNFFDWYTLFHGLYINYQSAGLEEIDIGQAYNAASGEATPTYISDVANGALLMYHLKPPNTDEGGYEVKHKKLKVILFSGIHGSERKSIYDNYIFLKELCESTYATAESEMPARAIVNIRNLVDLYIVPMINVSGINSCVYNNANNININRDFAVKNWKEVSGSSTASNSQWETRVVSYALDKVNPDVVVDHHTSSGNNRYWSGNPTGTERGKFLQWANTDIPQLASIIEENLIEITPYVKYAFPAKLGNTNFVFGHTYDNATNTTGTLARYAYQKGAIALTYEVVQHLKWENDYIFGYTDADEISLVSINYFGYANMIAKTLDLARDWINNGVKYKFE